VVVCDLNLPGYSGLDALDLLRREHPCLPRVLLSGDPSCVPAGTDAHVLDKNELSRLPGLVAALAA
jgi:CheY-like chemotaxis protein